MLPTMELPRRTPLGFGFGFGCHDDAGGSVVRRIGFPPRGTTTTTASHRTVFRRRRLRVRPAASSSVPRIAVRPPLHYLACAFASLFLSPTLLPLPPLLLLPLLRATPALSCGLTNWRASCDHRSRTVVASYAFEVANTGYPDQLPRYDARVVFRWGGGAGTTSTSTSTMSTDRDHGAYATGKEVEVSRSHSYDADGGRRTYYPGVSVTFGEGAGTGCEGRTFQKYFRLTFDDGEDDGGGCDIAHVEGSMVPTTFSLEAPTTLPTSPPSKQSTIRPTRASSPPSQSPTNVRLPTSVPTPEPICGDSVCSLDENDDLCPADCAGVLLAANSDGTETDPPGVMFSVLSSRDVALKSIHVSSIVQGLERVAVYTKPGGYAGHETNDGWEWTSVYNNWNHLRGSDSEEEHTRLDLNNREGVFLPAGTTTSFFVYTESGVRCRVGVVGADGEKAFTATDGVLGIYQGIQMDGRWTASGYGDKLVAFFGAFVYDVVKSPPTASPTTEPTPPPTTTIAIPALGPPTTTPSTTNGVSNDVVLLSPPSSSSPTIAAPGEIPPTPVREYRVFSTMVFYHSELLDANSEKVWTEVTEGTIHDEAAAEIDAEDSESVKVKVKLEDQILLEPVRHSRRMQRHDQDAPPYKSFGDLERSSSLSPVQIEFMTTIEFHSEEDGWDAEGMVASGFQSPAQRKNYIVSLREPAIGSYFESLESMSMEVGAELNLEDGTSGKDGLLNRSEGSGNDLGGDGNGAGGTSGGNGAQMYLILATVVGGVCIFLFLTAVGLYTTTRRKNRTEKKEKAHRFPTAVTSQDRRLPPIVIDLLESKTKFEALHPQQTPTNYVGTTDLKEDVDDVSTLGDPYMGDGPNVMMDTDRTVGESIVSCQRDMHAYGIGRPTGMDATLVGGSTINSGSYVRNNMEFGDDSTLEDVYRTPQCTSSSMMGESESDQFHCVTVVAPSGKLGIVLDNPHGDLPVVWAIKETSALNGRIRVGDLLLSVDGVDCRGMSTHRVSTFLSSRSQSPARSLVLARGLETGTEMVGL